MGEEIQTTHFSAQDFKKFRSLLDQETETLLQYFQKAKFSLQENIAGFELEAWLVDDNMSVSPQSTAMMAELNSFEVVPELAKFNFEMNVPPLPLQGDMLSKYELHLLRNYKACVIAASKTNSHPLLIGILPTIKTNDLSLENMSQQNRYKALNDQIMHIMNGEVKLHIKNQDELNHTHYNVMPESATTSLQIHLQLPVKKANRFFNAAIIGSAPMVAIAANSPFFLGKQLWDETRIPLFEQSINTNQQLAHQRVGFGSAYVKTNWHEMYQENIKLHQPILPIIANDENNPFHHIQLHNGTIWRWNRPLIGFDPDGTAHLRLEHRTCAAGPSIVDNIANIAFYVGLVHYLANLDQCPEDNLDFKSATNNFYNCAQQGFDAEIKWIDHKTYTITKLLHNLVPVVKQQLEIIGLDQNDIDKYIGIIEQRIKTKQNGANWQKAFAQKNNFDMQSLTFAYFNNQRNFQPVHEWQV